MEKTRADNRLLGEQTIFLATDIGATPPNMASKKAEVQKTSWTMGSSAWEPEPASASDYKWPEKMERAKPFGAWWAGVLLFARAVLSVRVPFWVCVCVLCVGGLSWERCTHQL